ncbi:hypothetical protein [Deinococcus yavapaiensis]|uniref:Uncharacterized protein n=1 Tax=Deinococcus yavapaiensis KR-236 TaxID=694435 RepID=A0A318SRL6_9DEIO|nr:hypothetical protein [Deinococcus yavapaiensis]PYE55717.1 hypothetical protein DES52_10280 [Deinococcus yavapaiensis KR-236]
MSHVWPEVPREQSIYAFLPTDYWPWSEVLQDLAQRSGMSGALELRQGAVRARVLFAEGTVLGAYSESADADLATLMWMMPRAVVSLVSLSPAIARLAWQCRVADAQVANAPWSTLRATLKFKAFTGVVRSSVGDSYWQAGVMIGGPEPTEHDVVTLIAPSLEAISNTTILEFYNQALSITAKSVAAENLWRAAALDLADDHLCLDPFAREVVYENGKLAVTHDLAPEELLPALRDAFSLLLDKAGRRAGDLGLESLRAHPLWALSSLGEA